MTPMISGSLVAAAVLVGPAVLVGAGISPAMGQDRLLRAPYITKSGATVDKPGQSQASGPTRLDRGIRRQNNKIDRSICKGC